MDFDSLKYKIGDLVMYTNKIDTDQGSISYFFLKPAKIIGFQDHQKYPYEIKLLKEDRTNYFNEAELTRITINKNDLDAMLIRNEIAEDVYEQILKEIESVVGGVTWMN